MNTMSIRAASVWTRNGGSDPYKFLTPVRAEACIAGQTYSLSPGAHTFYQEDSL